MKAKGSPKRRREPWPESGRGTGLSGLARRRQPSSSPANSVTRPETRQPQQQVVVVCFSLIFHSDSKLFVEVNTEINSDGHWMRRRWRGTNSENRAVHLPRFRHLLQFQPKMDGCRRKGVLLMTLLPLVAISAAFECTRDSECGDSYYCFGSVCERCIPCQQLFNRQPSREYRGCAKTETECGSCLKGYQTEELTNQRYSLKCYPIAEEDKQQVAVNYEPVWRWDVVLEVGAVSLVVCAIAVGLFFFSKCRRNSNSAAIRPDEEKGQNDLLVAQSNPPPYAPSAPSYNDIVWSSRVAVEREVNVQAAPIRRVQNFQIDNNGDQDDVLNHDDSVDRPVRAESDAESVSSTETIPSLWEPGSTPNLNVSRPAPGSRANATRSCSSSRRRLRRSASLDLSRPRNPIRTNLSGSDGVVAQRSTGDGFVGIYSGVHVRLASQRTLNEPADRISTVSDEDGYNSEMEGFVVDSCRLLEEIEPEAPQPFTFGEQLNNQDQRPLRPVFRSLSATSQAHGGSEDSGIYEAANRRRPLPSDAIEFTFRLSVKRMREDPQSQ